MIIFITGVTGFIGSSFLKHLQKTLAPDDQVFALIRTAQNFEDQRIQPLLGKLEEIEKFEEQLLKSDYVFHLAANATFGSDANYDQTNYEPTKKLVDILSKSQVLKNFVFFSTIGAVDRNKNDNCSAPLTESSIPAPTSLYGESKLKAEKYIESKNVPYTILRCTWVYGKNMRFDSHISTFVSMIYAKSPVARLAFPGKVSLIHVDDLSRALLNSIGNSKIINKTYFAEMESLSLGKVFATTYQQIHKKSQSQLWVPSLRFLFGSLHPKLPLTVSNLFVDYLCAKDEKFAEDFSLGEGISFEEGVNDVINTHVYNDGYWVITGANSGIGLELSKKLHNLNKKLILIDKNVENLDSFDGQVVLKTDLSDIPSIESLAEQLNSYKLLCFINNAGVGFRGGIEQLEVEQIKTVVGVNIYAPLLLSKLLLKNFRSNHTTIVNIASSVAYNPLPHMSVYASSKAFISTWSESLSYELQDTNAVVTLSPSGTYTNFQNEAGVKVLQEGKGLLTPSYVADQIIKAALNKKKVVILGGKTKILLAVSRMLPRKFNILLWGKLFDGLR